MPFRRICIVAWIEPSPGRHNCDLRHHSFVKHGARQACTTVIIDLHQIPIPDVARRGIGGIHLNGFTSRDFARLRNWSRVHLAVQAAMWLVGDKVDGPLFRARAAEPFGGSYPCGVPRTIVVAESSDRLRNKLNAAGRRLERVPFGIATKLFKKNKVAVGWRQLNRALGPEPLKTREFDAFVCSFGSELVVDPLTPAHFVTAFSKGLLIAEAPRECAKDVVIAH